MSGAKIQSRTQGPLYANLEMGSEPWVSIWYDAERYPMELNQLLDVQLAKFGKWKVCPDQYEVCRLSQIVRDDPNSIMLMECHS